MINPWVRIVVFKEESMWESFSQSNSFWKKLFEKNFLLTIEI